MNLITLTLNVTICHCLNFSRAFGRPKNSKVNPVYKIYDEIYSILVTHERERERESNFFLIMCNLICMNNSLKCVNRRQ